MFDADNSDPTEHVHHFHKQLLSVLPALGKHAMALTRHRADAEDLVQATVTSALAARTSFQAGTNFDAWISRILRNRFFSSVRRRRVIVDLDDVPDSLMGRNGGQEDILAIKDLGRHMQRLPANQRLILLMISIEGVSYDDASRQLGVAAGTLKCRVFRARAQLQSWMFGEENPAKGASIARRIPVRRASAPARER
jgi:RNA polymerase sigma-70 factor (ECF subfamily)